MSFVSVRRRVAFIPAASASGYLLLTTREVAAHADHYKTEQTEPLSSSDNQQSDLSSESENSLETSDQEAIPTSQIDLETNALTSDKQEAQVIGEDIPVTQASISTAKSGLFSGFSVGLGESLLVLIVAMPFILRIWKRRLKS